MPDHKTPFRTAAYLLAFCCGLAIVAGYLKCDLHRHQAVPTLTARELLARQSIIRIRDSATAIDSPVSTRTKNAYVTLLSSDSFLPGTAVLVESLRMSGATSDIVVMVLPHIGLQTLQSLGSFNVTAIPIDYVANPYANKMVTARQMHNMAKLRAFLLTQYAKVILIDSDCIVIRNIEHLFMVDGSVAAVKNYDSPFSSASVSTFNSGMLVFSPSVVVFQHLMDSLLTIPSYNGGDQGFLNAYFSNWTRLDYGYNLNKMMVKYNPGALSGLSPVSVIHFVRAKPWFDISLHNELNLYAKVFDSARDYWQLIRFWKRVHWMINLRNVDVKTWMPTSQAKFFYDGFKTHRLEVIKSFCPLSITQRCFDADFYNAPNLRMFTFATQLSYDRLDKLVTMAEKYEGPITAAIFIHRAHLAEFVVKLLYSNLPWNRVIVSIVVTNSPSPFPINILRNLAISNSPTDLLAYVDVDFLISPGILKGIKTRKYDYIWSSAGMKHVYIIPAFESTLPFCTDPFVDETLAGCLHYPLSKSEIVSHYGSRAITAFHAWKKGHRATNFDRWIETSIPYYVEWTLWFEPYIIMRKSSLHKPFYDERFFGRGRNKLTLAHELHLRGFQFVVLPEWYLIHDYERNTTESYLSNMACGAQLYDEIIRSTVEELGGEQHIKRQNDTTSFILPAVPVYD